MSQLDDGFAALIRRAESQAGMLIPPDMAEICRRAFFAGAIEAATLIECHGATPLTICAEYRAAYPNDKRGL